MATRRYSRNLLNDGSQIVKSEVDYSNGLTFQFQLITGSRPAVTAFSVSTTSIQTLLLELSHFLNRANRILAGERVVDLFEDSTIF